MKACRWKRSASTSRKSGSTTHRRTPKAPPMRPCPRNLTSGPTGSADVLSHDAAAGAVARSLNPERRPEGRQDDGGQQAATEAGVAVRLACIGQDDARA